MRQVNVFGIATLLMTSVLLVSRVAAQCKPLSSPPPSGGYIKSCAGSRVIVFIHGLSSSPSVWKNEANGAYWPNLIADDNNPAFADTDVYVASYVTPRKGGRMTMADLQTEIVNRFTRDEVFERHQQVILVGHSLGGLLAQQILLTYIDRGLWKKVPALFLYGTPQEGSHVANLAALFMSDPLVKELEAGDNNFILHDVDQRWVHAGFDAIKRFCAYETVPEKGFKIVDRDSATRGCNDSIAIPVNHHDLVSPENRSEDAYTFLRTHMKSLEPLIVSPLSPQPHNEGAAIAPIVQSGVSPYNEVGSTSSSVAGIAGELRFQLDLAKHPRDPRPRVPPISKQEIVEASARADRTATEHYLALEAELRKANTDALQCMKPTPDELTKYRADFEKADQDALPFTSIQDLSNGQINENRFNLIVTYMQTLYQTLGGFRCN